MSQPNKLCYCARPALLHGLCDEHYLAQFVTPLRKERDNTAGLLASLNQQLLDRLGELEVVRFRQIGGRMLTNPPAKPLGNGHVYCHKCFAPFDSGLACLRHEDECKTIRMAKPQSGFRREASGRSVRFAQSKPAVSINSLAAGEVELQELD